MKMECTIVIRVVSVFVRIMQITHVNDVQETLCTAYLNQTLVNVSTGSLVTAH